MKTKKIFIHALKRLFTHSTFHISRIKTFQELKQNNAV
jgi:hypothetical protein